jgi:thioredoxin reductase (NADPH)
MTDLLIVGAGPAGLTAALYAHRSGLRFILLEQDGYGGGQIVSAHRVQNYPGFPDITGAELGDRLRGHVTALGVDVRYGEVSCLSRTGEGFLVSTTDGDEYPARAVIAATGGSPRPLGLPREKDLAGVSYCALCDGAFFAGQDVLVIGGGDTAVEDALYLSEICAQVTIVLRRDVFRAADSRVELLLQQKNVTVRKNTQVTQLFGEQHVEGVLLSTGETLPVRAVFVAVGTVPSTGKTM